MHCCSIFFWLPYGGFQKWYSKKSSISNFNRIFHSESSIFWWFQTWIIIFSIYIYLIFTYIYILLYILYYMFGNNPSHWLIFFKRVIAPNQILVYPDFWKPWKMVGLGPPPVTTSSTRQGYRNWDSYETLEIMGLPSGKLTWLWKIWLIYLVKMVNFHSHVSLPEDIRG